MSINSWKKEFYPQTAESLKDSSDEDCLLHSIKKWTGALPENLQRHDVKYYEHTLESTEESEIHVSFSSVTCALCKKYAYESPYPYKDGECECFNIETQKDCPIVRVIGKTCSSVYQDSYKDAEPMIDLLIHVQKEITP